jgi:hypothetical protein
MKKLTPPGSQHLKAARGWLAYAEHLNAWVEHAERFGSDMAREFSRGGVVCDFPTSVRIVN